MLAVMRMANQRRIRKTEEKINVRHLLQLKAERVAFVRWRRASLPAVEPWLPARRKKTFGLSRSLKCPSATKQQRFFPDGRMPSSTSGRDARRHLARASILVGLLWCLALLALVVVGVLHTARMDLLGGKHFGDRIQAHYLALAGIEKAKALLYKSAKDRSHSGKNHTGEFYDSAKDFREIEFARGTYSVLRRARADEGGGVIYGVADEESRLNLNTADADALQKIQGLGSDVAAAILGWRGQGNAGETDYYLALRPPYKPRGGPFETIRELLMVRGVSSDLLLGNDVHQNGLLDALEDGSGEKNNSPQFQNSISANDLGWAGNLTVDSGGKNVNAAGESRVNIQSASESALGAVRGITPEIAKAIVAYRGQNRFSSIADLLDVTPPQNNENANNRNGNSRGGRNRNANNNSAPDDSSGGSNRRVIDENLFSQIADDVTVSSDETFSGLINLNTAGADVLACLPGVDRNLAQAIIAHRQSTGFFDNLAGVMKVDGMTKDIFKSIAPLATVRSETFHILGEGRVKSTGATQRIQMIVRVNLDGVKTLSYREDDL
jgi:DNA uptake protein ComE-like DNA-binding protein